MSLRDRGTTRKERMLLAIGIVVVAVWFGLYAWFAEYLQLFTSPAPSFSIGFGTAMALVPSVVMILLVGFAIQITHKRHSCYSCSPSQPGARLCRPQTSRGTLLANPYRQRHR